MNPITGVNTLLLSASNTATPDIVALAATATPTLTAVIPGATGSVAFSVATVNVGSSGAITVTADTGGEPTTPERIHLPDESEHRFLSRPARIQRHDDD